MVLFMSYNDSNLLPDKAPGCTIDELFQLIFSKTCFDIVFKQTVTQ